MLVERDVKKTEFAKKAGISSASLSKLGKGANVTTDILVKICEALKCDISDICEIVSDETVDEKKLTLRCKEFNEWRFLITPRRS